MSDKIVRYYVPENNKEGASFPGVPLSDIEESLWEVTPEWIQRSVDASPMYRKTNVSGPKPVDKPAEKEKPIEVPAEAAPAPVVAPRPKEGKS